MPNLKQNNKNEMKMKIEVKTEYKFMEWMNVEQHNAAGSLYVLVNGIDLKSDYEFKFVQYSLQSDKCCQKIISVLIQF